MSAKPLAFLAALCYRLANPAQTPIDPIARPETSVDRAVATVPATSSPVFPPTLETLPTELVGSILDFGEPVDIACLSLTSCRLQSVVALFDLLQKQKGSLGPGDMPTLSRLLEPSARGYSYCARRQKLVIFTQQGLVTQPLAHHNCTPGMTTTVAPARQPDVLTASFAFSNHFKLPWCTAHLFANHHRFGPSHGVPPSVIRHNDIINKSPSTTRVCEGWDAWVSGAGEVQLRCTRSWTDRLPLLATHFTQVLQHQIAFCAHVTTDVRRRFHDLAYPRFDLGRGVYNVRRTCARCGAVCDIQVRLSVRGSVRADRDAQDTWVVTAISYYNLGACQSVDDVQWGLITGRAG
ncbi:hypothetical protein Micbo1qcDRAFT_206621 [Microdochium bolleyi]|uniref:F-box domain-containing protein n=1 Tax=Microdochium bolleyi TaxID=196109 RepID=A0A136IW82_9PEZI|nr:hypothetical protein Micbo1qcDRAFT_206621 [Microdochium bolleyi]